MWTFAFGCSLALIGIVGLYLLLDLSLNLRKLLTTVERIEDKALPSFPVCRDGFWSGTAVAPAVGYSIWVCRNGQWVMEENHCEPGYESGAPPDVAGSFEGDRIKQEGVPSKK